MIDASAVVDALVPGTRRETVLDRIVGSEPWAPSVIDSELLSALARMERAGAVTATEATHAVDEWLLLRCERVPSERLLHDAWSRRAALRVSDAQYVALAARLGAPLITCDARLARAPVSGVEIELIA